MFDNALQSTVNAWMGAGVVLPLPRTSLSEALSHTGAVHVFQYLLQSFRSPLHCLAAQEALAPPAGEGAGPMAQRQAVEH